MLLPRQKTPSLDLPTLDHGTFSLSAATPKVGTLITFYRGYHCPICANYLKEMAKLQDDYAERGVDMIAISSDNEERARMMQEKVGSDSLRFGYDLSLTKANEWGLYISTSRGLTSIGVEEPALFSEPGLFLVHPDMSLYYGSVQTMPFTRPHFSELLGGIDFALANEYPARGEYTGAV